MKDSADFKTFWSEELRYGGLVGLHSLPDTEEFCRKMSMMDVGGDLEKENLRFIYWHDLHGLIHLLKILFLLMLDRFFRLNHLDLLSVEC